MKDVIKSRSFFTQSVWPFLKNDIAENLCEANLSYEIKEYQELKSKLSKLEAAVGNLLPVPTCLKTKGKT